MIGRLADLVRGWSRAQWVLRLLVVAGYVLAALASAGVPGASLPVWWALAVVAAVAVAAAVAPDGPGGLLAGLLVLLVWVLAARTHPVEALGPWAVAAAVGLVGAHLAAGVAAYGPAGFSPDRRLVALWVRRGLLVLVPSVLVVLVVRLVGAPHDAHWLWAAAALVVGGLAAAVTVVLRTLRSP